jgi:transglutaminase-like putative cysteine protease
MAGALAVFLACLIPASPSGLKTASDAWNSISRPIRERLSNAVSSLSGPYGRPGPNFYGSSLALGQQAATGDTVVLTVKVLKAPDSVARYYWRGRVYDDYKDGRWTTTSDTDLAFRPAAGNLGVLEGTSRSEARFRVTSQFNTQSLLYGPAPIIWVDTPARVQSVRSGAGSVDPLAWESQTVLENGKTYEVHAELEDPTVVQLRAAGQDYPDWITSHYLVVPEAFRPRLQSLAEAITAGTTTPYDRAAAITNYLRLNIQYSTSVPAPPEGQDPVMWVLFDYKKGFCNYFASADVWLLRSIGVPARLAVGFARGEQAGDQFTVRRRDAHAWPEAYFPGIGWVEFEPTANQTPLSRPTGVEAPNAGGLNPPAQRPRSREDDEAVRPSAGETASPSLPFSRTAATAALKIALPLLVIGAAVYLGYRFRLTQRLPVLLARTVEGSGWSAPEWIGDWEHWNQLEPVERYFAAINWSLRWLGKPQPLKATPGQRAAALETALPSAASHIAVLRRELEVGLFTPQQADLGRARKAAFMIALHALRARLGGFPGN